MAHFASFLDIVGDAFNSVEGHFLAQFLPSDAHFLPSSASKSPFYRRFGHQKRHFWAVFGSLKPFPAIQRNFSHLSSAISPIWQRNFSHLQRIFSHLTAHFLPSTSAISPIWSHFSFVNHWKSITFRPAKIKLKNIFKNKALWKPWTRGKKKMPFRHHSALFFLPFLKISEVPNRHQRPFLPSVNMEKGFTSQSDGLATTHQVPLRYLLRNGTAAFHRWSSGYSAQFLPSSLVWLSPQVGFGLLCKIFSQCWTLRNQRKGKDVN